MTIQTALDALEFGEVVKALDRGPHRENPLVKNSLRDLGLISEKQASLEFVD